MDLPSNTRPWKGSGIAGQDSGSPSTTSNARINAEFGVSGLRPSAGRGIRPHLLECLWILIAPSISYTR